MGVPTFLHQVSFEVAQSIIIICRAGNPSPTNANLITVPLHSESPLHYDYAPPKLRAPPLSGVITAE